MKKIVRHLTDLSMTIFLVGLMAYSITGQEVHEWMGVTVLTLFVLHHLLNIKWFRALGQGRYTLSRMIQSVLVILLTISVAAQIISGLSMSRHALPFLDIPISTSIARLIHLSCGYWSFLLMSLHLGFHWGIFLGLGQKLLGGHSLPRIGQIALCVIVGAAALYGVVCFVQQNIADYLFLRTEFVFFDYEKSPLLVLGELAAMMALWVLFGYLLQRISARRKPYNT